jgi:hypothetical protein
MSQLKRSLGLTALTFSGVGLIIGAGIYSEIGAAAGRAGAGLWLSFVVGAVAALLTGLSYAELTTTFPEAGAEYTYTRHATLLCASSHRSDARQTPRQHTLCQAAMVCDLLRAPLCNRRSCLAQTNAVEVHLQIELPIEKPYRRA